ncbi:MAG: helix-turn-helix transcriptional regulator [Bacteroides sp.]|nr:helix-turn-helix transcriptional regulator [Eubacterium sp.]MCM1417151.1 helix-turn-helix transcriptional regulator [Roseburia sp.]MCM1461228.1 helix-turn-helix transcriptional regulator [Bacteroides sp.]
MVKIHLRELLSDARLSQAELSRATGIRPSTICDLYNENAAFLKLEHLEKICKFLHCKVKDLIEICNE